MMKIRTRSNALLSSLSISWTALFLPAACSGEDPTVDTQAASLELTKSAGGIVGAADYCGTATANRCAHGEGDCDRSTQCQNGLVCGTDLGADFGFTRSTDVCVTKEYLYEGHRDYCAPTSPCSEGQGDCDRTSDCESGLVCAYDVGSAYGFSAGTDVCERELTTATPAPQGAGTGGSSLVDPNATPETGTGGSSLVDPNATPETMALFTNLRKLAPESLLVGAQDATLSGQFMVDDEGTIDWGAPNGEISDIGEICGAHAAVHGYDASSITGDWWRDRSDMAEIREGYQATYRNDMQRARRRGGVITIVWHQANPITGEDYTGGPRELERIVPPENCGALLAVVPGLTGCGSHWTVFREKLDTFADFMLQLTDDAGRPIPAIFRPFHENSLGDFWWGANWNPTPEYHATFRAVWAGMVDYLTTARRVHQLLYAISPNGNGATWGPVSEADYLAYSPGLDLVDVLGLDFYTWDMTEVLPELRTIVGLAESSGKIAAQTEGGTPFSGWENWPNDLWSRLTFSPILADPVARRIAYFQLWRNDPGPNPGDLKYGPFHEHPSTPDFLDLCSSRSVLLEGGYPDLYTQP